jgi:hypothetical protein
MGYTAARLCLVADAKISLTRRPVSRRMSVCQITNGEFWE